MVKKGFVWLYIIIYIFLIASIAFGAYYLGRAARFKTNSTLPVKDKQINPSPQQIPTDKAEQGPLFSGTVKKNSQDLGLFKITNIDKENNIPDSIVYFEAGKFIRGEFKDYTRILAIRPSEGPGPSLQFILATKDFKSYLLDDPKNKTTNYPEGDWDNPYTYLDKAKISKVVTLDSEHPGRINLDTPFGLIKEENVLTENKKTGEVPITQFDQSQSLISPNKQLTFFAGSTEWGNGEEIRKKYLHSNTLVHAQDSTGLTFSYVLTTQKDIDTYLDKLSKNEQEMIAYKKQVALFNEKKLKDYPTSPQYIIFPGMKIDKPLSGYYNTYESAFPGACGGSQSTFIVDSLKDDELEPVLVSSVYSLYTLKNSNHPLNQLAYQTKTNIDDETYKSVNDGKSKPTFEDYVAKHPLLFFKDTWGRWVVLGEFDIKLMGGCGKPVVYLYPEKQTNIRLSFMTPIILDTQIPVYHDGWSVMAKPDGTLTDLQPQFTDCAKIDSAKFGSEYASKACLNNTYPYLFWSGKVAENPYPKVDGGWIVEQENLQSFMDEKLKKIGLTTKESADMTSYWVAKMKENNSPYYRISFILTSDMNQFIPMNVDPKPDSVLRVFLDYKALDSRPSVAPEPQSFSQFKRTGFTLVEWGGAK